MCQVDLIGPVEKKIFNFVYVFSLFRNYLFLEKGHTLYLNKKCFVPSLVESGPVVLEKKMKMWKVYRQTDLFSSLLQYIHKKYHIAIHFSIPVYWQRCLQRSEFRFGLNWNPLWKFCIQITKCSKLLQYILIWNLHLIHSPTDGQTDGQMDGKQ